MKGREGSLSPLMALRLAAPHTWAAAILPVLLGTALAYSSGYEIQGRMLICLTAVCVLMQSAVNTLNDYCDYIKGTDTLENSPDASDAVLVYDRPEPKKVLILGLAYLACAGLFGIPAIIKCGWRPLAIGIIGALAVVFYSFGKKPLSYLPLGELCSGLVMGGLIPVAVYGVFSDEFTACTLLPALPIMLGIGMIMLTNNASDIERDTVSGRRTFAVMLGQKKAGLVYKVLLIVWLLLPVILCKGIGRGIYLIAALPIMPQFVKLYGLELGNENRGTAMQLINNLNLLLGFAYILARTL
jgi:1,4-dihydroxy-2-naphthoate octaprenyltransferase